MMDMCAYYQQQATNAELTWYRHVTLPWSYVKVDPVLRPPQPALGASQPASQDPHS